MAKTKYTRRAPPPPEASVSSDSSSDSGWESEEYPRDLEPLKLWQSAQWDEHMADRGEAIRERGGIRAKKVGATAAEILEQGRASRACGRCYGDTRNGEQCKLRTCVIGPFCWMHMMHKFHLKRMPSTIDGAGSGLFAWHPKGQQFVRDANGRSIKLPIFRKGELIFPWSGDILAKWKKDVVKSLHPETLGYPMICQYTCPKSPLIQAIPLTDREKKDGWAYYIDMGATNSTPIRYANHKSRIETNAAFKDKGLYAKEDIYHKDEIFVHYNEDISKYLRKPTRRRYKGLRYV